MARYRVGNRYLSESEYEEEVTWGWIFWIFIISALITGGLIYKYIADPAWNKYIRFTIIVLPSLIAGTGFAFFHNMIRIIIAFCFAIGVIFLIGLAIWNLI